MSERTREGGLPQPGAQILVTGAAGGIGMHAVRVLCEAGYRVRAVDRLSLAEAQLSHEDVIHRDAVEWSRVDLTRCSRAALERLVEGCEGIIHAAAKVSLTEEYEEFVAINVDVTRALYEVGSAAGVKRFVYMSCGSLYAQRRGVLGEDSEIAITNGYEQSKLDGERALPAEPGPSQAAWTILRPALVYGPFCRRMSAGAVTVPPILRGFSRYLPGFTGGPRTNWCHAEDAARAALFVMAREDTAQRVFNVGDDTPLGLGEVMTSITEAYGLEVGMLFAFPGGGLQTILGPLLNRDAVVDPLRLVLRQIWRRVQQNYDLSSPLRPRIDRKAIIYTTEDALVDASALRALGWSPRWDDFRAGIVETIRWYQDRGWVPRYDTQTMLELEAREFERGLSVNEVLEGGWTDGEGKTRRARLDLDVEFPPLRPLAPVRGNLDGTIELGGVGEGVVRGTIAIDGPLAKEARYEFGFAVSAPDGVTNYRFQGHKRLDLAHPFESLSQLDGELFDQHGASLGTISVAFDPAERVLPLLVSLRFLTRVRGEAV